MRWLGLTLRCRYDLYATVNHMGSIDGGHYVAHMQVKHARTFTHTHLALYHTLHMDSAC